MTKLTYEDLERAMRDCRSPSKLVYIVTQSIYNKMENAGLDVSNIYVDDNLKDLYGLEKEEPMVPPVWQQINNKHNRRGF